MNVAGAAGERQPGQCLAICSLQLSQLNEPGFPVGILAASLGARCGCSRLPSKRAGWVVSLLTFYLILSALFGVCCDENSDTCPESDYTWTAACCCHKKEKLPRWRQLATYFNSFKSSLRSITQSSHPIMGGIDFFSPAPDGVDCAGREVSVGQCILVSLLDGVLSAFRFR